VLSIGVAVFGSLEWTKNFWGHLRGSLDAPRDAVELVVVDNGSPDGYGDWLRRFVLPFWPGSQLLSNADNRGVPCALNQAWRACSGDVVALLHNDLYFHEPRWQERFLAAFAAHPKLGVAGLHGARGLAANGGRCECWSNLLEAELHGSRGQGEVPVAVLDGMALVCRRQMLEAVGGFDESLGPHHFYDKDLCLSCIEAGYWNLQLGVAGHHDSGQTASSLVYREWVDRHAAADVGGGDLVIHQEAERRFLAKWRHRLPLFVPDHLHG
jgi:glycosyltransferase involved in cell wall biosynthesis